MERKTNKQKNRKEPTSYSHFTVKTYDLHNEYICVQKNVLEFVLKNDKIL